MTRTLRLGAVAYDPKVVTIWDGFRVWLRHRGLDFDYVLYSHYERQVEELVGGSIDVAWNSPLAWVRTRRMVPSATSLVMRDTDQDLVSVIVVPADSSMTGLEQLTRPRPPCCRWR
jgi:phosphonate transport system substrate-binding protein